MTQNQLRAWRSWPAASSACWRCGCSHLCVRMRVSAHAGACVLCAHACVPRACVRACVRMCAPAHVPARTRQPSARQTWLPQRFAARPQDAGLFLASQPTLPALSGACLCWPRTNGGRFTRAGLMKALETSTDVEPKPTGPVSGS